MRRFIVVFILLVSFLQQPFAQGKNFIKGLKGTDSLSLNRVTMASLILPGYGQAYNRQYWKIPTLYVSAGALIYGGIYNNNRYHDTGLDKYRNQRNLCYIGAGLLYLGSAVDAVANYKTPKGKIIPAKASFFSTLVPGLGQAYNGDYWKIPIIYAGFSFLGYWYDLNQTQYKRFRNAYNAATDKDPNTKNEFAGRLSNDAIKRYRDKYRRDRDYAILYVSLFYVLNVIEANVFAHLSDFDVSENLAFNLKPTIIPESIFFQPNSYPAVGFTLNITFKDKKKRWL